MSPKLSPKELLILRRDLPAVNALFRGGLIAVVGGRVVVTDAGPPPAGWQSNACGGSTLHTAITTEQQHRWAGPRENLGQRVAGFRGTDALPYRAKNGAQKKSQRSRSSLPQSAAIHSWWRILLLVSEPTCRSSGLFIPKPLSHQLQALGLRLAAEPKHETCNRNNQRAASHEQD